MLRYALQSVRARKGGFLAAFLALLCAAALVTACGALLETGLRGTIGTERYAAAPVVVGGDQYVHRTTVTKKKGKTKTKHKAKPISERAWLSAEFTERLARVRGVRAVVPEVTFPAYAVTGARAGGGEGASDGRVLGGPDGKSSYGHAWTSAVLTPFRLLDGTAPTASDEVVVDRELARRAGVETGARLTVQATGAPRTYRVSGVAAAEGGDLTQQSSLFFSTVEAERLSGRPGQVAALGVLPAQGVGSGEVAARVREALDGTGAHVATGSDRGPVEFLDAAGARVKLVSMGGAIGGTALLVAVLVVVGTFALSLQQRHRELALLRAVAATPRQVRQLIGREALLVGLLAGVVGSLAGLPLAAWLHGRFVALGAIPETLELAHSVFPSLAAVAASLLAAWSAARISARRTARIRPAEALAEAAVERRTGWGRLLVGAVAFAAGVVLLLVLGRLHTEPASTPVTFLTVIALAVAVALLGPLLVRLAVAALGLPLRASRVAGYLAAAHIRANTARMAAATTPLVLLIGMACTVLFVPKTMGEAASRQAEAGVRADRVVTSSGPGVPAAAAGKLREVPGVTAVTEVVRTSVRVGLDKYAAQGLSTAGLRRTWDPDVVRGHLAGFGADSVALSTLAADHLGKKPGDSLRLTLGDGTAKTLTVTAVYARGLGFGDVTLAHALVVRHVDNPLASSVLLTTHGADPARLAAAVAPFPGVGVLDRDRADGLRAELRRADDEVEYLAMGLVIAFTAIAVVNTLAMSVSDRSRELALLRLVGATRRQLRAMLRTESLIVFLTAAALGTTIAYAVLTAFSVGMTDAASPTITPWWYAAVLALAATLTLLATLVPGRVALRGRAGEGVGEV
ncbi:FtsX-like permease family protein [Streptomyces sp. NPDC047046]|uniref:FtsX-like permease family protein n=1 Tax=Streptomyces sp. NPDC047046 TaxID=3155378 RepID=UPI0033C303CB